MDGGALDVVAQETPRCFTDARTQFRDEPGAARVHAAPAVRDACENYMPLGSVSSAVGGCRGGVSFLSRGQPVRSAVQECRFPNAWQA
jgi:hypothetical protein